MPPITTDVMPLRRRPFDVDRGHGWLTVTNQDDRMIEDIRRRPEIVCSHLRTVGDGIRHQIQCVLTEFELKGVGDFIH